MTDEEIAAITQEAHRVRIPVAAHAQGPEGVKNALRNGVDTIEHGIYLDDECIELLNETGSVLVPMLAIVNRICEHGIPEFDLKKAWEAHKAHIESVRRAYEAGVTVALGTNFVGTELIQHGENAEEMVLCVEKSGWTRWTTSRPGQPTQLRLSGRVVSEQSRKRTSPISSSCQRIHPTTSPPFSRLSRQSTRKDRSSRQQAQKSRDHKT